MKASLFHHNLNSPGGELTVAIETAIVLQSLGYEVHLNTVEKPNFQQISKTYGKQFSISNTNSVLPFKLGYFGVYQRLLEYMPSKIPSNTSVIINTSGGFLPFNISTDIPIITYIHFPPSLMTSFSYANNKYSKSLKWKMYFKPYQKISSKIIKDTLSKSTICIANSQFTKNAIKEVYPDIDPIIIYPPVDVNKFLSSYQSNKRSDQVIVISRFSPEKQIEKAIKIAKLLEKYDIKFKIMGSLLPSNSSYFVKIKEMVVNLGIEDKVSLIPNATFHQIQKSVSESKVYLHTMTGDHFGISIVEAMAGGLIPIVPSIGGCSEIVDSNYHYYSVEQAAELILNNIKDYSLSTKEELHNRSKQFSSETFRKRMQDCLQTVRPLAV